MSETRKLATILFADIAGYTALMQKDEKLAIQHLNRFKEVLEKETAAHQGSIVQYFGDGCLLSFESSTKAVNCAVALQHAFSAEPVVPVRIGIHMGEVLFKENNVYGDGVNIASRIESIGIPGAILMSRTVRDQIKNKGDFLLVSLGDFDFKNVDEPVEVYALANPGFVVPRREEMEGKLKSPQPKASSRWLVPALLVGGLVIAAAAWLMGKGSGSPLSLETRKRPVAVMPFENQTMQESMDAFGLMAMDWISQGLLETGETRVIKEDPKVILAGLKNDPAYLPQGAEVLIKGRYYPQGESEITVMAEIIDANTKEAIYSPEPFVGGKNDPMALIESIQQQILGYWVVGDGYYEKKPPRFDAYDEMIKAQMLPGDAHQERKGHYLRAMELDPEFIQPGINLLWQGVNSGDRDIVDTALVWLEKRESDLNEYERLTVKSGRARALGDFEAGADVAWQIYDKYHQSRQAYYAMYYNNSANRSSLNLRLFPEIVKRENPKFESRADQHGYLSYYLAALCIDGQYDTVSKVISQVQYPIVSGHIALIHLRALTLEGDMQAVDSMLQYYRSCKLEYVGPVPPSFLLFPIVIELNKAGKQELLDRYLDIWEEWLDKHERNMWSPANDMALAYLRKDYQTAYDAAMYFYNNSPAGKVLFTEAPAICLLKLGKEKEARQWLDHLIEDGEHYPGALDYARGMFEGHRGNIEKAIVHLRQANENGFDYDWYNYRYDVLAKELMQYPEFMELTEPK